MLKHINCNCSSFGLCPELTTHCSVCAEVSLAIITCREDDRKEARQHDEYAIGTYLEDNTDRELVGHVPMELSYLIYTFLRACDDNEVSVKVTGSRRLENGLVVPGTFKARTPRRAIATKFEREILRLKELCAHMDISVETLRKIPTLS